MTVGVLVEMLRAIRWAWSSSARYARDGRLAGRPRHQQYDRSALFPSYSSIARRYLLHYEQVGEDGM